MNYGWYLLPLASFVLFLVVNHREKGSFLFATIATALYLLFSIFLIEVATPGDGKAMLLLVASAVFYVSTPQGRSARKL